MQQRADLGFDSEGLPASEEDICLRINQLL